MEIYIILGGGDAKTRPRCKKLVQVLERKKVKEWEKIRIILSGYSSFRLNVKESEAQILQGFLMKNNIPKESIILEEQSLDTIGNIVFSREIVDNLIDKNSSKKIEINLITESFHMRRSRMIFELVYSDIKRTHNNVKFKFIKANTDLIINSYMLRKLSKLWYKILKTTIKKKEIKDYLQKLEEKEIRILSEFSKYEAIKSDFKRYRISNYEEVKYFLFCLPVYCEKYTPKKRYDLKHSVYFYLIKKLIEKRKKYKGAT